VGYWPDKTPGPWGFTKAYSGRKVCHRCGKKGKRETICTDCELIVCKSCGDSLEKLCVDCFKERMR
jgi:hypothetical protein